MYIGSTPRSTAWRTRPSDELPRCLFRSARPAPLRQGEIDSRCFPLVGSRVILRAEPGQATSRRAVSVGPAGPLLDPRLIGKGV